MKIVWKIGLKCSLFFFKDHVNLLSSAAAIDLFQGAARTFRFARAAGAARAARAAVRLATRATVKGVWLLLTLRHFGVEHYHSIFSELLDPLNRHFVRLWVEQVPSPASLDDCSLVFANECYDFILVTSHLHNHFHRLGVD